VMLYFGRREREEIGGEDNIYTHRVDSTWFRQIRQKQRNHEKPQR
jgi:hypothetical protein